MAYRIRLDGVTGVSVECDTSEEAFAIIRRARGAFIPASPAECNSTAIQIRQASPRRSERTSNTVKDFLSALKESYPSPISSDQLAAKIGTTVKGIPAVVLGVHVLFRKWGVKFEDVIEWRKRSEGAGIVRQYRLTTGGLRVLQEQSGEREPANDLGQEQQVG